MHGSWAVLCVFLCGFGAGVWFVTRGVQVLTISGGVHIHERLIPTP